MRTDLTGLVFGRWTVLGEAGKDSRNHKKWLCRCECGVERAVLGYDLKKGKSQSCGCLSVQKTIERSTKHGGCGSRLYVVWADMIQRCVNPNRPDFKYYGGKGVSVCPEWRDYASFAEWAQRSDYREDLTIDRIDVDGDYEPSNCRWVTWMVQQQNRTNVHDIDGLCLAEYSRLCGINYGTLWSRLHKGQRLDALLREGRM